jgi:hypothetical protein
MDRKVGTKIVSAKQIMTTELEEQKFRTWNKSRLYGEQKFSPRNKSCLEKLEQKYCVIGTNRDYRIKPKEINPQTTHSTR